MLSRPCRRLGLRADAWRPSIRVHDISNGIRTRERKNLSFDQEVGASTDTAPHAGLLQAARNAALLDADHETLFDVRQKAAQDAHPAASGLERRKNGRQRQDALRLAAADGLVTGLRREIVGSELHGVDSRRSIRRSEWTSRTKGQLCSSESSWDSRRWHDAMKGFGHGNCPDIITYESTR